MRPMIQKSQNQWNADDYARNSSAQETWAMELIDKLKLRGYESVLDIGCGDGRITDKIAQYLTSGCVVGIDQSENMIRRASDFKRVNLSFRVMDVMALCLEQEFDIAYSNAVMHWVKDHRTVLQEVRKHLKPGGRILFQMGGYGNAYDMARTVESVIVLKQWSDYFQGFNFPYYFYQVHDYEQWLPEAGFEIGRVELIPKDMVHDDAKGLKGWLRTTWFPYTDRVPETDRELFVKQLTDLYLSKYPVDAEGKTHVRMVRLEVEARRI
jgi:trans-aconitate 2-methyltransferase